MNMKQLAKMLIPVCGLLFMESCSKADYKGQLLGVQTRSTWRSEVPYGMVHVPTGVLHVGNSDQDVPHALTARAKQVSILGFYMDATEITNNEYRQFEEWVKDSIAHTILNHVVEVSGDQLDGGTAPINWDMEIDWSNSEVQNQLGQLYLPKDQWVNGQKEYDQSKMVYKYDYVEWKKAAFSKFNSNKDRKQYIKTMEVDIYPDTLCWIRDFTYSYNEPMVRQYYSHPAFDDYPVVGIRWDQATAFCFWRTHIWNDYKQQQGELINDNIRLPIEHEWEYAARGGKKLASYPWGGPYTRNSKGCLLANFKPGRGNYPEDGGFYTVRGDAYWPNDYGLYNMAGNVSEWTSSAFYEAAYSFLHDMNPDLKYDANKLEPETMKRKVIRGGSWKDIAYYIQTGTRHWEYQDSSKSYIGFRCLTSVLGKAGPQQ